MKTTGARKCVWRSLKRGACRRAAAGPRSSFSFMWPHPYSPALLSALLYLYVHLPIALTHIAPLRLPLCYVFTLLIRPLFCFLISLPSPTSTAFLLIAQAKQDRHPNCATTLLELNRKALGTCSGNYSWNSGCGVFPQRVQGVPLSPGRTCLNMQTEEERWLEIKSAGYPCLFAEPSVSQVIALCSHVIFEYRWAKCAHALWNLLLPQQVVVGPCCWTIRLKLSVVQQCANTYSPAEWMRKKRSR